ncbi:hypothetical protein BBJ28_00002675 [Nothophytophthora sp. Chile5]|nr:hypothetical protein BBJ28_00002675 [Nothophytophthora sp. Chile5]
MKCPSLLSTALAALALQLPLSLVKAHGYMTIPTGRTTDTINDMDNTGACDSDQPGTVTEFSAGQEIDVQWTRNNHIGGFIRFALAPSDDVSHDSLDAGAFFYVCREVNCDLKECTDDFCGDDPGSADNEIKCGTTITLPEYLESGDYVLQWTWFAAGSSYGHIGWTTGNYRTCADIRLTTSGNATETGKPACPTFVGGDRVTEMESKGDDQCFYFDTNDLVTQEVKYDDEEGYTRYLYGIPAEMERCGGGNSTENASEAASGSVGADAQESSTGSSPAEVESGNDSEIGDEGAVDSSSDSGSEGVAAPSAGESHCRTKRRV